ncbi:MAG: hypothetical protein WCU88_09055 [Elusimicrobiota bacterium]|jgi:hypothetical protein
MNIQGTLKKISSTGICASIVMLSPGLGTYAAVAQTVEVHPAASITAVPAGIVPNLGLGNGSVVQLGSPDAAPLPAPTDAKLSPIGSAVSDVKEAPVLAASEPSEKELTAAEKERLIYGEDPMITELKKFGGFLRKHGILGSKKDKPTAAPVQEEEPAKTAAAPVEQTLVEKPQAALAQAKAAETLSDADAIFDGAAAAGKEDVPVVAAAVPAEESGKLTWKQKLSPARIFRTKVTEPIVNKLSSMLHPKDVPAVPAAAAAPAVESGKLTWKQKLSPARIFRTKVTEPLVNKLASVQRSVEQAPALQSGLMGALRQALAGKGAWLLAALTASIWLGAAAGLLSISALAPAMVEGMSAASAMPLAALFSWTLVETGLRYLSQFVPSGIATTARGIWAVPAGLLHAFIAWMQRSFPADSRKHAAWMVGLSLPIAALAAASWFIPQLLPLRFGLALAAGLPLPAFIFLRLVAGGLRALLDGILYALRRPVGASASFLGEWKLRSFPPALSLLAWASSLIAVFGGAAFLLSNAASLNILTALAAGNPGILNALIASPILSALAPGLAFAFLPAAFYLAIRIGYGLLATLAGRFIAFDKPAVELAEHPVLDGILTALGWLGFAAGLGMAAQLALGDLMLSLTVAGIPLAVRLFAQLLKLVLPARIAAKLDVRVPVLDAMFPQKSHRKASMAFAAMLPFAGAAAAAFFVPALASMQAGFLAAGLLPAAGLLLEGTLRLLFASISGVLSLPKRGLSLIGNKLYSSQGSFGTLLRASSNEETAHPVKHTAEVSALLAGLGGALLLLPQAQAFLVPLVGIVGPGLAYGVLLGAALPLPVLLLGLLTLGALRLLWRALPSLLRGPMQFTADWVKGFFPQDMLARTAAIAALTGVPAAAAGILSFFTPASPLISGLLLAAALPPAQILGESILTGLYAAARKAMGPLDTTEKKLQFYGGMAVLVMGIISGVIFFAMSMPTTGIILAGLGTAAVSFFPLTVRALVRAARKTAQRRAASVAR